MPLSLNTSHPLYGNLKLLIGVDDDNVLKDLVTPARTITPRAQSSYGSGTYGRHFRTGPSPSSSSGASLSFKPGSNYGTLLVVTNGVTSATAGEGCGFINAPAGSIDETTIPQLGHYPTTGKIVLRALDTTSGVTRTSGPTTEAAVGSGARSWVGTASATSYAVYVDGQLDNSGSWTLTANTSGEFVNIGVIPGFSVLDSNIVWIAWFDKVLSAAEVESLHASLGAGNQFGLVGSGAPPTPPSGTTTITDVSPGTTSALVTYNYSAGDATGFEYRLGGGTAASIGASPATVSGLTASTPYSIEVRAINAAGAGAWSAAYGFSTAAAGDTTPPTLTGVVSFSDVTQTSYTASWPAGSDNVAVTGYEYQIGGTAGAWTDAGADLSEPVTGRTPGATETVYVRAYDAAGLRSSPPIAGTVTLLSASTDGTITVGSALYPIKYSSESVLNESGLRATVLDATTLAEVLNTSGVVCSAGVITITDPALVIGNTYHLVVKTAAGWTGISDPVTAS